MHSNFSPDGDDTPEAMCRRAVELGIPEIGFTEHWDPNPLDSSPGFLQVEAWFAEIERLRAVFAGRLTVRAGIEIDEPHVFPESAAAVLQRAPFDYVIGSVHFVGPQFMFDEDYFRKHTADEVFEPYFAEAGRLARAADFDVLGHLDIPARTALPITGYDPRRYESAIRSILKVCIERGLTLDVNAAGLRKKAHNLMPDPIILGWYAEMGGRRVTLGSDAHCIGEVGLHLDAALEAVRAAGIRNVVQFERRQARLISI
jgi:histidinol-phosphatase (PHP family)